MHSGSPCAAWARHEWQVAGAFPASPYGGAALPASCRLACSPAPTASGAPVYACGPRGTTVGGRAAVRHKAACGGGAGGEGAGRQGQAECGCVVWNQRREAVGAWEGGLDTGNEKFWAVWGYVGWRWGRNVGLLR